MYSLIDQDFYKFIFYAFAGDFIGGNFFFHPKRFITQKRLVFVSQASEHNQERSCSRYFQTISNNSPNCVSRFGQNAVVACVIYNISSLNRTLLTTLELVGQSLRPIVGKKNTIFQKRWLFNSNSIQDKVGRVF